MPAKLTAATRNKQVETVICYTIYIMLTKPYKNYDRPLKDGHRRLLFRIPPLSPDNNQSQGLSVNSHQPFQAEAA